MNNLKNSLWGILMLLGCLGHAQAGLIVFTDRGEFEIAVGGAIDFDGLNDPDFTTVDIITGSGFKPYRTTTSHISEGTKALSIKEYDTLTINFDYDVFAIGFDVNELNSSSLSYFDSAGHSIIDALEITDVWNESNFFGVISDTALRSFSLAGNGDSSLRSTYGFDALAYTASAESVPEPTIFAMFGLGIFSLLMCRSRHNTIKISQNTY